MLEQLPSQQNSREASLSRRGTTRAQDGIEKDKKPSIAPISQRPPEVFDSNPLFKAEKSRRAWRLKRQADRGPKPHHRKHRNRKSNEIEEPDTVLQAPGVSEPRSADFTSKFEMDSEDDQSNLDPDIILVKHKGSIYSSKFPAFSIGEGSLLVGDLRRQVARDFGIDDTDRVTLLYNGRWLRTDSSTCHDEGLKMRSQVLCVVKRTSSEELEFLANKFRAELVPQGLELLSNAPSESDKKEVEYKKISETILAQILLKIDTVETQGDGDARTLRKNLVKEVQGFLNDLDAAMKKDTPSDWHADFLPQRQARKPDAASADPTNDSRDI